MGVKSTTESFGLKAYNRPPGFCRWLLPARAESLRGAMRAECCGLQPGLVSVVLPVYNQAGLLREAVEGVLAQTYRDWELILVDDGSIDGVHQLLDEYSRHPQVRCFSQDNQGLPKALSNGFDFAAGEFWTWTSADNIMAPRMLERLVAKLKAEPDLGMVYADYYAIDDRGELLRGDFSWRSQNRPQPSSAEIRLPRSADGLNTVQDNFIGPCFLYRGWIGRLLGDYAPQTGIEDYDYWMRMNAFFPLRHLGTDELLYRYRVHDNTISARSRQHRILKKVRDLMRYEKERAVYFRSKIRLAADPAGRAWLSLGAGMGGSMGRLQGGLMKRTAGRLMNDLKYTAIPMPESPDGLAGLPKDLDLLLMESCRAARLADELNALDTPLGLLFSDSDDISPRVSRLLQRNGCIALTADRHIADRIHRIANCPLLDIAATQSPAALLAFAKNHRHFHHTWPPTQLSRQTPTPARE